MWSPCLKTVWCPPHCATHPSPSPLPSMEPGDPGPYAEGHQEEDTAFTLQPRGSPQDSVAAPQTGKMEGLAP